MIIIRSRTLIYNCRYLLHHSAFNGQFFQWESRKCLAATSRVSPAKQARGCISVAKVPESLAALRQMHPPQSPAAPALPYGKATHYDLCVAGAPTNRVRCHPGGGAERKLTATPVWEPRILSCCPLCRKRPPRGWIQNGGAFMGFCIPCQTCGALCRASFYFFIAKWLIWLNDQG